MLCVFFFLFILRKSGLFSCCFVFFFFFFFYIPVYNSLRVDYCIIYTEGKEKREEKRHTKRHFLCLAKRKK